MQGAIKKKEGEKLEDRVFEFRNMKGKFWLGEYCGTRKTRGEPREVQYVDDVGVGH